MPEATASSLRHAEVGRLYQVRVYHPLNDELCNPLPNFNLVIDNRIRVDQDNLHLSTVGRVDKSWRIEDRDAVGRC